MPYRVAIVDSNQAEHAVHYTDYYCWTVPIDAR